jgi:Asp-tRNA(Asn)/Glu-tRNA(Gln) amidotransferase A subunit family amidase
VAEPAVPRLRGGIDGLRIATAGGYFLDPGAADANEAVSIVAAALQASRTVEIPEAARARAAAYLITASEGGNHHLSDLRTRADEYDPNTRTRLIAGALMPAAFVSFAQQFRTWFREQLRAIFEDLDIIIAPATPCPAIRIGQQTITLNGEEVAARPNLGVFTQPVSFVGLPVVTVPVHLPGKLPIGVQLIGPPFSEAMLLRAAYFLADPR